VVVDVSARRDDGSRDATRTAHRPPQHAPHANANAFV